MNHKEKIAGLITFYSLLQQKEITLDEYVAGKKEDQKQILYLIGQSRSALQSSPYVEQARDNGVDVLLLTDPIDEWVMGSLRNYKDCALVSVTSHEANLGDTASEEKKKETEAKERTHKDFLAYVQGTIGAEKLEAVKLTHKLKEGIAIFSTKDGQPSAQMEKMMKMMGHAAPATKKTLELNAEHPLITKMMNLYSSNAQDTRLAEMAYYLYDQATLLEGGEIENMNAFIKRVNDLLV